MTWDVVVLGLGGMGSAALARLAIRGSRVLGIEQFEPMHGLGSSHGNSRIIRQTYFLDSRYVPLAQRAYALWRELEAATGERLMTITGGLMLAHPDDELVDGALGSAREHGLAHEVLDRTELRRRFPIMRFRDGEIGLYEPTAGYLRPEACIRAHLQVAMAHGARAFFGTRVLDWTRTGDAIQIVTDSQETIRAKRLIMTAGPWLGKLTAHLQLPLVVERQVMHWFAPASRLDAETLEALPVFIASRNDRYGYGLPFIPGYGLKAAFHGRTQATDPDAVNRSVDASDVQAARNFLRDLIPSAAARHCGSKVCLYTMTPDEHFVIGQHPRNDAVVLAGGFSGHGFKFCTVVGEIVADLALDGGTRHSIGFFSPNRFALMRQASKETPGP